MGFYRETFVDYHEDMEPFQFQVTRYNELDSDHEVSLSGPSQMAEFVFENYIERFADQSSKKGLEALKAEVLGAIDSAIGMNNGYWYMRAAQQEADAKRLGERSEGLTSIGIAMLIEHDGEWMFDWDMESD